MNQIRWNDLPMRFTQDSIDREIFKPEGPAMCSIEQAKRLLNDAEFYIEPYGPDEVEAALIRSAKAVAHVLMKRLGNGKG